jgi:hypothetical protein
MVKPKKGILQIFPDRRGNYLAGLLVALSLLTFISSWAGIYPPDAVERWYARLVFPRLSYMAGRFADSVEFAWLDVAIPVGLILLVTVIRARKWVWLLSVAAGLYLVFFWSWGLNYHRQPLNAKLQLDAGRMHPQAMTEFARRASAELNRLYGEKQKHVYDESRTRREGAKRVRRVVAVIDGSDWESSGRIKVSRLSGPWLRAAGVDGLFNPFGHEPIINGSALEIERPFVIAHELAHVRGYPDEGDANLIATFATLMSDDPAFQYSGWLHLWLYLRTHDLENLLDPGPRRDIQRLFERARAEQIPWISGFQQTLLDWLLKANSVNEGVQSYSRGVLLAAAAEPFWERFR